MKTIKITLAQIKHAGYSFKKQTEYMLEALNTLEPNITDLIILPELCPGKVNDVKNEAIRLKAFIVAGVERIEKDKFYNKAVVLDTNGVVVAEYTKMFLHSEEIIEGYKAGDFSVVFKIGDKKIGLLICSDLGLGIEATINYFHRDVDLIVIPSNAYPNSLEYWRWHMVIRSLDVGIPICMVNYADLHSNSNDIYGGGHSMVATPLPRGKENQDIDTLLKDNNIKPMDHVFVELGKKQEVKTIELDLKAYDFYRQQMRKHRIRGLKLLKRGSDE